MGRMPRAVPHLLLLARIDPDLVSEDVLAASAELPRAVLPSRELASAADPPPHAAGDRALAPRASASDRKGLSRIMPVDLTSIREADTPIGWLAGHNRRSRPCVGGAGIRLDLCILEVAGGPLFVKAARSSRRRYTGTSVRSTSVHPVRFRRAPPRAVSHRCTSPARLATIHGAGGVGVRFRHRSDSERLHLGRSAAVLLRDRDLESGAWRVPDRTRDVLRQALSSHHDSRHESVAASVRVWREAADQVELGLGSC